MRASIILIIILFVSCERKISKSDINNIASVQNDTLKIKLSILDKNRFYYQDYFGNINNLNPSDNMFILEDDYFQLIDGKYKISFFLKKGETIDILDDGSFSKITSKTDTSRNKELLFPIKYFKEFDSSSVNLWTFQKSYINNIYVKNPSLRNFKLLKEYKNSKTFLENYQIRNNISKEFYNNYQEIIRYNTIEKSLMALNSDLKFPKKYVDSIATNSLKYLQNDKFIFLASYRNSVSMLLYFLKKNDHSKSYLEIINENFNEQMKYYLFANLIIDEKKANLAFDISLSELLEIKTSFLNKDNKYSKYVGKIMALDTINLKDSELLSLKNEKIEFGKIYSNKIAYIDFWASWCGPCREEMPASKKLRKEYEEKGINFIYISIDDDVSAWERASKQMILPDLYSYLLTNSKNSSIAKKFKLSTIPRYIVINKDGEVLDADAPRPSDPKTKILFDKIIK